MIAKTRIRDPEMRTNRIRDPGFRTNRIRDPEMRTNRIRDPEWRKNLNRIRDPEFSCFYSGSRIPNTGVRDPEDLVFAMGFVAWSSFSRGIYQ